MGVRNFLIEGVSGTGKTSVATELQLRGYHVIHGDRELAYQGDPITGEPLRHSIDQSNKHGVAFAHEHHLWDINKVRAMTADRSHPLSFFCGGSRNFPRFIDLFDGVFVLQVDQDTLIRRLADRPEDEFGSNLAEQKFVLHLHETGRDIPKNAINVDAAVPLASVVESILSTCRR